MIVNLNFRHVRIINSVKILPYLTYKVLCNILWRLRWSVLLHRALLVSSSYSWLYIKLWIFVKYFYHFFLKQNILHCSNATVRRLCETGNENDAKDGRLCCVLLMRMLMMIYKKHLVSAFHFVSLKWNFKGKYVKS